MENAISVLYNELTDEENISSLDNVVYDLNYFTNDNETHDIYLDDEHILDYDHEDL